MKILVGIVTPLQSLEKSVTQELAAASGVPPAFRKQLEQCCIFPQVSKCRRRAGGIAVQCGALCRLRHPYNTCVSVTAM